VPRVGNAGTAAAGPLVVEHGFQLPNVEWSDEVALPSIKSQFKPPQAGRAACGSASPFGLASEDPAAAADGWQA
jgi:hypothetical protein